MGKRIAHITTDYKPIFGGAETYLANLFQTLESAGYSQRVYQRDMGVKSEELVLVPRLPEILRVGGRGSELWAYNALLMTKARELANEDLLIVHYPLQFLPVFWHKRTLVLSHGVEWHQPPVSFNHKLKMRVARFAFDRAKFLVANDTNLFREMGVDLQPKEKMFEEVLPNKWFLPNCVDTDSFRPNAGLDGLRALNPILVPRNLSYGRGIHLALEAFALFNRDYPATNLVITGDIIDHGYFRRVLALVKQLKLSAKVFFLGGVPWREMPPVYASAQMTIIPTLFSEGTSLSALESMACGVATVSTNAGGLPDLPTVLAEIESKSLYRQMLKVYDERGIIGESQRREVVEYYNLGRWQRSWTEIVAKALTEE
ncbi:glycosyltransferase family 4 protein [Candidatus Saganbacteria bacterium]|nr:glycosyltransferase family 4 protein [Candidatus Saganbacteria bacterium]